MSDQDRPVRLSNWAKATLTMIVFLQLVTLIYLVQVYDFVQAIERAFQGFQP